MSREELYVGRVFKNLREICEWLGETYTKGNGKEYRIKEFSRHCKYIKNGNKYIVTEVFHPPLDKIEKRGGNNNKYAKYLKPLILTIDTIITTKYTLIYKRLRLVNELEFKTKDKYTYIQYNNELYDKLGRLLESSLKSLQNEGKITYQKYFMITTNNETRRATEEENKYIVDCKHKLYEEMNIYPVQTKAKPYKDEFDKKLAELLMLNGIVECKSVYDIKNLTNKVKYDVDSLIEFRDGLKNHMTNWCDNYSFRKKANIGVSHEITPFKYSKEIVEYQERLFKIGNKK